MMPKQLIAMGYCTRHSRHLEVPGPTGAARFLHQPLGSASAVERSRTRRLLAESPRRPGLFFLKPRDEWLRSLSECHMGIQLNNAAG